MKFYHRYFAKTWYAIPGMQIHAYELKSLNFFLWLFFNVGGKSTITRGIHTLRPKQFTFF